MCDKCTKIFSENETGWQTFTAQTIIEREDGERITKTQHLDACPECALVPTRQFPKEIGTTVTPAE